MRVDDRFSKRRQADDVHEIRTSASHEVTTQSTKRSHSKAPSRRHHNSTGVKVRRSRSDFDATTIRLKPVQSRVRYDFRNSSSEYHSRQDKLRQSDSKTRQEIDEHIVAEKLPWLHEDHQRLQKQASIFRGQLVKHRQLLPVIPMQHLLASMDEILRKRTISRGDMGLRDLSNLLKSVRVVDLPHLIHLLEGQHQLKSEQDNVIVLCGASGSGKTTTLLHLAGTTFEEVEMDGFFHLKPKKFVDQSVMAYQTSCGSTPMTRTLQVAHVSVASKPRIMVCDTPGHGVTSTAEKELATGLGLAYAMQNAIRVKPVVVMNSEEMGTRCSNLEEVFSIMQEKFRISTKEDLKPVEYIFTNYDDRHRTRLRKQLATLRKNTKSASDEELSLWEHFMNDIIDKTTPEANIVLPMAEGPQRLLSGIWKESFVKKPSLFFRSFASEESLQKLQVQLQITLQTLITALAREKYSLAVDEMLLLNKMTMWLPDVSEYAEFAKEAGVRQVHLIWEVVSTAFRNENFSTVFYRSQQLKILGAAFPTASTNCRSVQDSLWQYLMIPLRNNDYNEAIERIENFAKVGKSFPEAMGYARRVIGMLAESVELCVERGEYDHAVSAITQLSTLKETFREAGDCASIILIALRSKLESAIMTTDFKTATDLLQKLSSVGHLYPEAEEYTSIAPDLFLDTIVSLVARGDFVKAVTLINHLQKAEQDCSKADKVLRDGTEIIGNSIEEIVSAGDFPRAISLIQKMKSIEDQMPEASDVAVRVRLLFSKNIEKAFANNNYSKGFQTLEKLRRVLPNAGDVALGGLQRFRSTIRAHVAQKEYEEVFILIRQVNALADTSPEAKTCMDDGFIMIEDHALLAVEKQDFQSAISVLGYLSRDFQLASQTKTCTRMGMQAMMKNVAKSIEKRNYSSAIELIHEMRVSIDVLPGVAECARQGLEMLAKNNETAITNGDYDTSIKIMSSASEMANNYQEAFDFTKTGLNMVAQHLNGMRNKVRIEIAQACESQDLKKFAELMFSLKGDMDKVLKSEPLRKLSVQIHYKKEFRVSTTKNAKETVMPQLYTGQSFCSDNLQQLAVAVKEQMPKPCIDQANIEALIRNRKAILSTVMQLKIANKVLHDFPGGENVTAVYKQAFRQYYEVVETVLIASESSFKPPIDSRVFELQVWFLGVLISTFLKDSMDIGSEERKKMEVFEERRKSLMLQFEVRVSDAMELLSSYEFPWVSAESNSSYDSPIQSLNLSLLEPPRKILLSLGQTPQLHKMVAEHIDVSGIKDIVHTFDESLIEFLRQLLFMVEEDFNNLVVAVKTGENLATVLERAIALRSYNGKIKAELLSVRAWNLEIAIETEPFLTRLFTNQQRIDDAIETVKREIEEENNFGFGAFLARLAENSTTFLCRGPDQQLPDL